MNLRRPCLLFLVLLVMALSACEGSIDYLRPETRPLTNVKIIEQPRTTVWDESVPLLGKQFFVINNVDKSSGLINVSYSGDPEPYLDCGRVTSIVKDPTQRTKQEFPGSRSDVTYKAVGPNGFLETTHYQMDLDGRANLIFEQLDPGRTQVTINVHYVLHRTLTPPGKTETVSMTSNDHASFRDGMECVPTGLLERKILDSIR